MSQEVDNKEIRQYLLGELAEEDSERIEERLLTEHEFHEELAITEDELIDDYVSNDLSDDQRRKFEVHFLRTDARRRDLRFAKAYKKLLSNEVVPQRQPVVAKPTLTNRFIELWRMHAWEMRAAFAVLVVAVIGISVWLYIDRKQGTSVSLALTISNANRGGGSAETSKLQLPLNADAVMVSLILPAGTPPAVSYRVELENDLGEKKVSKLTQQDLQSVKALIRSSEITRGQYVIKLYATGSDGVERRINGSYFFTAE